MSSHKKSSSKKRGTASATSAKEGGARRHTHFFSQLGARVDRHHLLWKVVVVTLVVLGSVALYNTYIERRE